MESAGTIKNLINNCLYAGRGIQSPYPFGILPGRCGRVFFMYLQHLMELIKKLFAELYQQGFFKSREKK